MKTIADASSSDKNLAPDWGRSHGIRELWSEVAPGLFVGGTADDDVLGHAVDWDGYRSYKAPNAPFVITTDEFDAVVTMYAFARPVGWGVEELRWGVMDSDSGVDIDTLAETVEWAWRRWKKGKRVLCRCQAGLNRSSLIAALVLVMDGMEPQDAIDKIRRVRSHRALFNTTFVRLIHTAKERR